MTNEISVFGALVALFLPWLTGAMVTALILEKARKKNIWLLLGQGYAIGILLSTTLLWLWEKLHLPESFWAPAGLLLLISVVIITKLRSSETARHPATAQKHSAQKAWQTGLTCLLLALLCYRHLVLAHELSLLPLFPWDAWMNWAPKPLVWYHFGELVEWGSRSDWLNTDQGNLIYTAGAGNAWKYPNIIPLVQLWAMLGMGTADHTAIYYPWLLIAIAMGLACYGHLRLLEVSPVIALMGTYMLLSMPFINVHIALAGYADLWVAAFFGCAVMALSAWKRGHGFQYLTLAILLAIACTQIKMPGLVMGAIVLATALISLAIRHRPTMIGLTASVVVIITAIVIGIEFSIPALGPIKLSTEGILLPYLGNYDFSFHNVSAAFVSALFKMINWNLTVYLICAALLYLLLKPQLISAVFVELCALMATLLFIAFVYYFSERYVFALDYTQVNRAIIYAAIPAVFLLAHTMSLIKQVKKPNNSIF
ncbi:MAG: hypothetical protein ACK5ME_03205 [Parahaliea sp.]